MGGRCPCWCTAAAPKRGSIGCRTTTVFEGLREIGLQHNIGSHMWHVHLISAVWWCLLICNRCICWCRLVGTPKATRSPVLACSPAAIELVHPTVVSSETSCRAVPLSAASSGTPDQPSRRYRGAHTESVRPRPRVVLVVATGAQQQARVGGGHHFPARPTRHTIKQLCDVTAMQQCRPGQRLSTLYRNTNGRPFELPPSHACWTPCFLLPCLPLSLPLCLYMCSCVCWRCWG